MAGSVNLANVALGFDSSQITKGVDVSAGELRKLNGMFQSSVSEVDRYNAAMIVLDKSRATGAFTADRLGQIEASLAKKYGIETEAIRATNKATADLAQAQRDQIARQKQLDAELQIGITLRRQVATSDERMSQSIRQYDTYLKQGIIDLQTYNRLLDQMRAKPMATPMASGNIVGDLKSTLVQYAGMAAAFAGVKKSLSLAATAESNRIALEVLTGSVAKASMLFEGFIELDRASPLSRSDFSRAAKTLLQFGYAAEGTLPALKNLSEVSVGNADRFQSLALALGQVTASGRLMGQEVLQMVNAGFNPLQEISRTTGVSTAQLRIEMEKGAISAAMVADAFASATAKGGDFYEMNERLKNTTEGQFAKMKSDVEMLATEIGTNLLPATKDFMTLVSGSGKGSGVVFGGLAEFVSDAARAMMAVGSDAFTNLDGTSKGTAIESLQADIQTRELQQQLELQFKHVETKEQKERIAASIAKRAADERKELEAIAAKEKAALDEQKQLEKDADETAKKAAKDKQKEIEDLSKKFDDAHNKRIKDAEALGKATMDPLKEYEAELARIEALRAQGAIGDDLASLGRDKAGQKLIGQAQALDKSNALGISQTIAPALKAGSVEAYKFMLGQKDKLFEAAQGQQKTLDDQLAIAKQQLTALQNQPLLNKKRP